MVQHLVVLWLTGFWNVPHPQHIRKPAEKCFHKAVLARFHGYRQYIYISLAIFMVLSKALDTLDHQTLLNKLKYYGVNDISLNWFSSFLTGRQQYVEIDGYSSGLLPLTTRVPTAGFNPWAIAVLIYISILTIYQKQPTSSTLYHIQVTQGFIVRCKCPLHPL